MAVDVAVTAIICTGAAMLMYRVLRLRRAALEHSRQIEEALQRLGVAQERLQRDDQRLDRFEQRLETVQRCMIEQLATQAAVPTSIHRVTIPDSHNWLAEASASAYASAPAPAPAPAPVPVSATAATFDGTRPPDATSDNTIKRLAAPCYFLLLPAEALQRVLTLAGSSATTVVCERVCREWHQAVAALPFWPAWRARGGSLAESPFLLPGTVAFTFGAPPTEISAEVRAAGARAIEHARQLAPGRLQLALCGTQWTVLHMAPGGTGEPTALCQHQARDFLMCACAASGLVFSGDKEAQLRVWCARTGELLARVGFSGAAVTAMAASAGRLLVGDSQGHVTALSSSALLRGETHAIAWRAHDGKTATLHARPYDDGFLSGGTDGAVRSWQYAELQREAHELRMRAVSAHSGAVGNGSSAGGSGRLRSSACVELGLFAIANPAAMVCVARHQDTVTALCRDGELAVSGSREGEVQVRTFHSAAAPPRRRAAAHRPTRKSHTRFAHVAGQPACGWLARVPAPQLTGPHQLPRVPAWQAAPVLRRRPPGHLAAVGPDDAAPRPRARRHPQVECAHTHRIHGLRSGDLGARHDALRADVGGSALIL